MRNYKGEQRTQNAMQERVVKSPPAPVEDELGEQLYCLVEEIIPDDAPKITGMLLELGEEKVRKMIADPIELKKWILKAKLTLAEDQGSN